MVYAEQVRQRRVLDKLEISHEVVKFRRDVSDFHASPPQAFSFDSSQKRCKRPPEVRVRKQFLTKTAHSEKFRLTMGMILFPDYRINI